MSNLLDKELELMVNQLIQKNRLHESIDIKNEQSRKSMLNKKTVRESYGQFSKFIYSPPSSDEEREPDEFNDQIFLPSVREVCQNLFDSNLVRVIDRTDEFPDGVMYGILMSNFDDFISVEEIKIYFEEIPLLKYYIPTKTRKEKMKLEIDEIRIFTFKGRLYALIKFPYIKHCIYVYDYFNKIGLYKKSPALNSKGNLIKFEYAYDVSDLKNSQWYSVVMRDLPKESTMSSIEKFCSSYQDINLKYVLQPMDISNSLCCLVVLGDLESAEKLCVYSSKSGIRTHLHIKCCRIRKYNEKSHYANIVDKTNKFDPQDLDLKGRAISITSQSIKSNANIINNIVQFNEMKTNLEESYVKKSLPKDKIKHAQTNHYPVNSSNHTHLENDTTPNGIKRLNDGNVQNPMHPNLKLPKIIFNSHYKQ